MDWKPVARFPKPKNNLLETFPQTCPLHVHVRTFYFGFFKKEGDWEYTQNDPRSAA